MTDRELAKAVHDLQEIARVNDRIDKGLMEAVIDSMELQFIAKDE